MSLPISFTLAATMSATELNALYTALPTVVSATITASGNYGYLFSDKSILAAKNWSYA
jgi:hypothetical protein